ncbi:MAG: hypothetical protein RID81_03870 [Sandaracinaceae bacterium]
MKRAATPISLVFLLVTGCGAATPPDADAAFREIQVHEATIAHNSGEAERCEPDAPCPARDALCEAADALCAVAETLEDADADARCALARRRCAR